MPDPPIRRRPRGVLDRLADAERRLSGEKAKKRTIVSAGKKRSAYHRLDLGGNLALGMQHQLQKARVKGTKQARDREMKTAIIKNAEKDRLTYTGSYRKRVPLKTP